MRNINIKPYYDYLKYVLEHKKNVFIECWNNKLYLHAFTHDLSKFTLTEFLPYARYFYIDKEKYKDDFEVAWIHHYRHNPHHWNYWCDGGVVYPMPLKYIRQMICDWKAMSRKFGDSAQSYYLKNRKNMTLHNSTRVQLEWSLGLLRDEEMYWNGICLTNEMANEELERLVKR